MSQPATEILLGVARDTIRELSDIPFACCNGGASLIDWADGLRGRLKAACAAVERAEADRKVPTRVPTGRRKVLFDRRKRRS